MATFWSPTTKAVVLAESPALDILNAVQIQCGDSAGGSASPQSPPGEIIRSLNLEFGISDLEFM